MKGNKYIIALLLVFVLIACSTSNSSKYEEGPVEDPPVQNQTYSSEDATSAFESFNKHFYSPEAKLYFETTERQELGSIWTQAIFWDIVMDAYQRTEDPEYLQMIHDIYEGGYNEYDGYNWENKKEWFIYDDIMWWVIALSWAHTITGKEKYLDLSISGFDRVWRDSYDPEDGGYVLVI